MSLVLRSRDVDPTLLKGSERAHLEWLQEGDDDLDGRCPYCRSILPRLILLRLKEKNGEQA